MSTRKALRGELEEPFPGHVLSLPTLGRVSSVLVFPNKFVPNLLVGSSSGYLPWCPSVS